MADKKKSKQKKGEKDKVTEPDASPKTESAEEENGNRDFGGFPDRDLKKNLGCGG